MGQSTTRKALAAALLALVLVAFSFATVQAEAPSFALPTIARRIA